MEQYSETCRILSIDWDYFIEATIDERAYLFPDGGNENLSSMVSDFIWATKYCDSGRIIKLKKNIRGLETIPLKKEYNKLRKIIRNHDPKTKAYIFESHSRMYNIVKELNGESKVEIYNVDFHHDVYNYGDTLLNCGNWLRLLIKEKRVDKAVWIKDKDSDNKPKDSKTLKGTLDFDCIDGIKFDIIFLCKSCVWSPPHLDKKFLSLMKLIKSKFYDVTVGHAVNINRMTGVEKYAKIFKVETDKVLEYRRGISE